MAWRLPWEVSRLVLSFCTTASLCRLRLTSPQFSQLVHNGRLLRVSFGNVLQVAKAENFDWRCLGSWEATSVRPSPPWRFLVARHMLACAIVASATITQWHFLQWDESRRSVLFCAALIPYNEEAYTHALTLIRRQALKSTVRHMNARYTVLGQQSFFRPSSAFVVVRRYRCISNTLLSPLCAMAAMALLQAQPPDQPNFSWFREPLCLAILTITTHALRTITTLLAQRLHMWARMQCSIWDI